MLSLLGTQQIVGDVIEEWLETRSISDTQLTVGDLINIQYYVTEGKRLDNGQINL